MQADAWRTDSGEWRTISSEPTSSLWSILGYLRWHAPAIAASDSASSAFPDMGAYLASRPLVIAVDTELARRGECEPGEAIVQLRVLGLAPWELPREYARRRTSMR